MTVEPGQRLSSERLLVQPTAAPLAALQGFGDAIAAEMQAVPWPEPIEGWCSWYYYWQGVSEEHIMANLGTSRNTGESYRSSTCRSTTGTRLRSATG